MCAAGARGPRGLSLPLSPRGRVSAPSSPPPGLSRDFPGGRGPGRGPRGQPFDWPWPSLPNGTGGSGLERPGSPQPHPPPPPAVGTQSQGRSARTRGRGRKPAWAGRERDGAHGGGGRRRNEASRGGNLSRSSRPRPASALTSPSPLSSVHGYGPGPALPTPRRGSGLHKGKSLPQVHVVHPPGKEGHTPCLVFRTCPRPQPLSSMPARSTQLSGQPPPRPRGRVVCLTRLDSMQKHLRCKGSVSGGGATLCPGQGSASGPQQLSCRPWFPCSTTQVQFSPAGEGEHVLYGCPAG